MVCCPGLVRAASPRAGSAGLGKFLPLQGVWVGFVQARWGGAGRTALQSGDPPLSPGTPFSKSVQAWLEKIRKEGWGAGLILDRGVSFCGSPSQEIGLETLRLQQQPGRSLAKALTALWGSAPPQSPAEPEPMWGWKSGHPHHCHLLRMQI